MTPAPYTDQAPVPPPSYHQTMATALHLDALTLVTRLHLLELCRVAVQVAQRQCPPPLPAGPCAAPPLCNPVKPVFLVLVRAGSSPVFSQVIMLLPARPLAVRLLGLRPRVVRLDAAYRGPRLIAWIHTVLHAAAVIPWNPKRQKQRDGLPPTWTAEELGRRSSIERFFSGVMVFFRLQRPPVLGWSAVETRVALTYAAVWVVAIAAWQAGRPDLIRSPRLVLAHVWEGVEL